LLASPVRAVETMTASGISDPSGKSTVEGLAFGGKLREQRRRLPEAGIAMRIGSEAPHRALHVIESHRVGVEHRSAAIARKAVAGEIHDVDIGRAQRNAFVEKLRALVHERVDATLDDLLLGDLARREAVFLTVVVDQRIDRRIGQRVATTGLVAIPAEPRLLAEAAELAQPIGDARIDEVRLFDVAALADGPADVVARQIAHAKRPHRHAETLERAIDLRGGSTFLEEEQRLPQILLDHAVADES